MAKNKQDQQELERKKKLAQKQTLTPYNRKYNTSSADTIEEIDALANNPGSVDTDIEREYRGLNKTTINNIKKNEPPENDEPEQNNRPGM
jgi:hypothetical protein